MKITEVTPVVLRGDETYGANAGAGEATDQGDLLLLVRVATDEGLVGWSDVETLGPVAARILSGRGMGALGFRTIAEELHGRDPLDVEQIWTQLYIATAYYGRRGVAMHCISAVDNCLWSIRAQASGVDLASELGGRRRDRLPAYASTLFRHTPEQNAIAARRYVEAGFRGIKFGWGGFGVDWARDQENLAAITSAMGAGTTLMIDPGWYVEEEGRARYRNRQQTVRMLELLDEIRPYWIEDFVHPEQLGTYRTLKAEFPGLRFAAGEQQATPWDFARLVDEAEIDILQPDLTRCGGLSVATEVARSFPGTEIVTHSWLTDLLHANSLHFLATLPAATWIEFNVAQSVLTRGVVRDHLRLAADGTVAVPTGVGIGVEVDEEFIRARQIPAGGL
jgi:L-alanine-DL-glutamate epimerase-like enolase superfamily enzyme